MGVYNDAGEYFNGLAEPLYKFFYYGIFSVDKETHRGPPIILTVLSEKR